MAITGRARFGQLLLFIALLLGIAMMHTVGHPAPGNGGGAAEHTVASSTAHIASAGHQQITGPTVLPRTGPELPGMGMDPMAVCLAVLDTFSVFLLAGGLLRPGPATPPAVCHARIFRALWPNPPSRKTLLARLSVLRI